MECLAPGATGLTRKVGQTRFGQNPKEKTMAKPMIERDILDRGYVITVGGKEWGFGCKP
jgi:hypothetical protein